MTGVQTCALPISLHSRAHVGDGYVDFATITGWVRDAGYAGDVEVEIFRDDVWDAPGDRTVATLVERYARHVLPYL